MAILDFVKPDKVILLDSSETKGTFEFRPLEPGYGLTVGNALRRVLLSGLEGFAISKIKIEGVEHEFSSVKGIVEDVTEIILNLKQVRLKKTSDFNEEEVTCVISNQDQFKAGDLNNFISGFEVINTDLLICNMEKSVKFEMTFNITKGRGYVPAEENKGENDPVGTIAIDSIYTPVKNVKYSIENFRVEQKTDYEKLVFDLETDGSIMPAQALRDSAEILIYHFMLFSDENRITNEPQEKQVNEVYDEQSLHMRQLLKSKLVDLELSVRALNCLKAAEVETLGELVTYTKNDLMKFRNFGKKSLVELEDLVERKGLEFGMDTSKYNID